MRGMTQDSYPRLPSQCIPDWPALPSQVYRTVLLASYFNGTVVLRATDEVNLDSFHVGLS